VISLSYCPSRALLRVNMCREQGWRMVVEPEGIDPSSLNGNTPGSRRTPCSSGGVGTPFEEIAETHKFAGKRTGAFLARPLPAANPC
jgi:hypothetical protein